MSGHKHLTYRGAPKPSVVIAVPPAGKQLVAEGRAARPATPQQVQARNIGRALARFYAIEPLPPELLTLLGASEQRDPRA